MKYTTISFPGLGLEMNPPSYFNLGNFSIHFYGVIIALGLVLAVLYGWKRAKPLGFDQDKMTDGVLWIVPLAVLCARLYYCIFKWEEHGYGENPISILYIWNGGLAIYGGVLGAIVGVAIYCKVNKVNLPALLDLVALGFLIGQMVGRWGNFFNREAFGGETDWFLRMGLFNTYTQKWEYHHPTFLYESVWNFIGFLILHFASKRKQYDGQIALGYAAWYGFGRMLIEGLRTDSLYWGDFRVSQLLAAVSCFAAAAILLFMTVKEHDTDKLFVNQVSDKEESFVEEASEEEEEEEKNEEAAAETEE
jgi:phosphatidylglycerol:prolipoprotein diacylglycerol transferase